MKVVEAGEIGAYFGEDLFADLCENVDVMGGWKSPDIAHIVRTELIELCKNRLPERGYTIEATKEEIMNLDWNVFAQEVTLAKKENSRKMEQEGGQ